MKKIIKLILVAAVVAVSTVSCDVERFPYNAIEQTQAFQSTTDAETLRNGMYAQLRARITGIQMHSTDIQADLWNASLDFGNRQGFPHRWEGFLSTDYTIQDVWAQYYSGLVNVNNIIENIGLVETTSQAEVDEMNRYLGEAYLLRAWYYHQLVIRYGKPYNASTSGTDLGVPLVLTFDPTLRPERATVAAVYQQILEDLGQAKTLLSGYPGSPGASYLTGDAVLALESRVHLHMGNWSGVITAAEPLISSGRYPLVTTEEGMKAMWHNDSGDEMIFQLFLVINDETASTSGVYLGFQSGTGTYSPDFIPQQWIVDMYAEDDIRRDTYLETKPVRIQGADYEGIYLFNKYPGNPALYSGNTNYQHKPKMFRIAEVILNKAEAEMYVNEGNALATLNMLRVARGLDALVGVSGNALWEALRMERVRELLGEGMRLNDLMRWNMGVERKTPQDTTPIETGANYDQLTKPAGHYQFVWGIPQRDVTINPNMVQNEGW